MFYTAHRDNAVIHAYDLDQSPDGSGNEEESFTKWPMYRIYPEAVVTELTVAPNRKWVYAVNGLGRVECFESRPTGRLERLPSIDLPEGKAVTLAVTPSSERFYVASDAGKVFGSWLPKTAPLPRKEHRSMAQPNPPKSSFIQTASPSSSSPHPSPKSGNTKSNPTEASLR